MDAYLRCCEHQKISVYQMTSQTLTVSLICCLNITNSFFASSLKESHLSVLGNVTLLNRADFFVSMSCCPCRLFQFFLEQVASSWNLTLSGLFYPILCSISLPELCYRELVASNSRCRRLECASLYSLVVWHMVLMYVSLFLQRCDR